MCPVGLDILTGEGFSLSRNEFEGFALMQRVCNAFELCDGMIVGLGEVGWFSDNAKR